MFTGLVQEVGRIRRRQAREGGMVLEIGARFGSALEEGESVAVDGVCLTVAETTTDGFTVEVVPATLRRTTLGSLEPDRAVNLERALRLGDRLGGHLVQGHVDGLGEVLGVEAEGDSVTLRIRLPGAVARTTVSRGSLAVDGVSLTVQELEASNRGEVAKLALVPYTWENTSLSRLSAGAAVNLEADMVGKYVEKLVDPYVG